MSSNKSRTRKLILERHMNKKVKIPSWIVVKTLRRDLQMAAYKKHRNWRTTKIFR